MCFSMVDKNYITWFHFFSFFSLTFFCVSSISCVGIDFIGTIGFPFIFFIIFSCCIALSIYRHLLVIHRQRHILQYSKNQQALVSLPHCLFLNTFYLRKYTLSLHTLLKQIQHHIPIDYLHLLL